MAIREEKEREDVDGDKLALMMRMLMINEMVVGSISKLS